MRLSTLLLPSTLAIFAAADPNVAALQGFSLAREFRRSTNGLSSRDTPDVDPEILCGKGFKDCGEDWCCTASQECAGKIAEVPMCKDPSVTTGDLKGTAAAVPYQGIDGKLSSLTKALAEATAAHSQPTHSKSTNAATPLGLNGFEKTAGAVVAVWGLAALGGVGLLFL